jgi:FdhD protein
MATRPGSKTRARVRVVSDTDALIRGDDLATEEPLELRLAAGGQTRTLAVTMRTPGNDFELAAGFLHGEGVVTAPAQLRQLRYCTDPDLDAAQQYNIVTAELAPGAELPDLPGLERHFTTTSACGVCGKASLEALALRGCRTLPPGPRVDAEVLYALPDRLRAAQGLFESTGGLHAAGLFTPGGTLECLREDVGRHNAVDKLIGWALLQDRLPLSGRIMLVSGRSSYEILQKALAAGIPVVCSVSAPSSLAVAVAEQFGITLVGFLRGRRFNLYAGGQRIRLPASAPAADRG